MTAVYLADDHPMVRVGLRHVLTELGGFEVVGEAEDGRRVLGDPALDRADVLLLDLSLPVVSGLEVLRRVQRSHPSLAVVVHSMHPEGQFRRRLLEAGAAAYVSKEAHPSVLIEAVRRAARVTVAPEATEAAPASEAVGALHDALTGREHEVFLLIVMGRAVSDIAAELDVHVSTVSNHLAKVRAKLGARTNAELVHYAYAAGLVRPPPSVAPEEGA